MRILVVEDSAGEQALLRHIFKQYSEVSSVVFVNTLSGASENVSECDVVILDLMLPDSMPDESVRWIMNCEKPVVVFSGSNDQGIIRQAAEAGALNFICKGAAATQLVAGVEFAIAEHQLEKEKRARRQEKVRALIDTIQSYRNQEARA